MTDQTESGRHHAIARDLLIPILVGVVGVTGSLGGVYLANANAAKQAEIQKAIELESKWLDQRIALIDRTAKIFGKSPGLQDDWERYLDGVTAHIRKESTPVPKEVIDKMTEAQGEFQSVIMLLPIYFGPKTNAALKALSDVRGPWWTKPKEKQDALLVAMSQETRYGIRLLPSVSVAEH